MICVFELEKRIAAIEKCTPYQALQIIQDMAKEISRELVK